MLSACTRKGSTLGLSIDVLTLIDHDLPHVNPWEDQRNHIPEADYKSTAWRWWLLTHLLKVLIVKPTKQWFSTPIILDEGVAWTIGAAIFGVVLNGLIPHVVLGVMVYLVIRAKGPLAKVYEAWMAMNLEAVRLSWENTWHGHPWSEASKEAMKEAFVFEFETRVYTQDSVNYIKGKRAGNDYDGLPPNSWQKALANPQLWYWYLAYRELDPDGARDRFAKMLPLEIIEEMEDKMDS